MYSFETFIKEIIVIVIAKLIALAFDCGALNIYYNNLHLSYIFIMRLCVHTIHVHCWHMFDDTNAITKLYAITLTDLLHNCNLGVIKSRIVTIILFSNATQTFVDEGEEGELKEAIVLNVFLCDVRQRL